MKSIFIAIPAYNRQIDVEILMMITHMQHYYVDRYGFGIFSRNLSLITLARNTLVDEFLEHKQKPDYLYFWDADITIQNIDFLDKMIETSEKLGADIVGGTYRIKDQKDTKKLVAGHFNSKGKWVFAYMGEIKEPQLIQ